VLKLGKRKRNIVSDILILIIDDDEISRLLLKTYLSSQDFKVIEAEDGPKGIELAEQFRPDLIICDIAMPGLDGFEVLRALQKTSSAAFIPFIFLTAQSDQDTFRDGMELGADDFLTKPVSRARLAHTIQVQLAKRQKLAHYYATEFRPANPFNIASSNPPASPKATLQAELAKALQRAELQVYYQPQVQIESGQIVGIEALLRWQHPRRGLISPEEFIPIAEESGLIEPFSQWVLHTACHQNRTWQLQYGWQFRVAVNLPARQFNQVQLTGQVRQALAGSGLNPAYLELELTETMLAHDIQNVVSTMQALKELGIQLAIDDFGTGYSSLSHLKHFPFDTLKLDRNFIRNLETEPKTREILLTIIQLAHRLNLKTVAEGVETCQQLAFLRKARCAEAQGYLFAKAMPVPVFESFMLANKGLILASA
jgi:EAL domain-containing protein (putative c-di-GMP-specific phosphodiesterase class I)/ActR/RegA family two-component response regulator